MCICIYVCINLQIKVHIYKFPSINALVYDLQYTYIYIRICIYFYIFLGGRNDLQDLFLDSESESGDINTLPHPYSHLGRQLTAVIIYTIKKILKDSVDEYKLIDDLNIIRNLADICGRDDILAGILIVIANYKESSDKFIDMLNIILNSAENDDSGCRDPCLVYAIKDFLSNNDIALKYFKLLIVGDHMSHKEKSESEVNTEEYNERIWLKKMQANLNIKDKIVLKSICGSGRRSYLLNIKDDKGRQVSNDKIHSQDKILGEDYLIGSIMQYVPGFLMSFIMPF
jgi:hypothetical protein